MKPKLHIKKGDVVMVITGEDKGRQGRVLEVHVEKQKAIVEGVNLVLKHSKPNAKTPKGGILKREAPVHVSNLMLIGQGGKPTRIGYKIDPKTNKKVRYAIKTGEVIK